MARVSQFFNCQLKTAEFKMSSKLLFNFASRIKNMIGKMKYLLLPVLLFFVGFTLKAQNKPATLSATLKNKTTRQPLPYVNIVLYAGNDTAFVTGTLSDEKGFFSMNNIKQGNYVLAISHVGFDVYHRKIFIGKNNDFFDLGTIELVETAGTMQEVVIQSRTEAVAQVMDKKSFSIAGNLSQGGGSVLQAMRNLPGITVGQDGKVQLRGSDRVTVLIDGKQTALTGFGNQAGLDNIPASAIDRIEIINNPTAKNDANGSAGIINIIFKKNQKEGLNGKVGLITGIGALWQKQENLPAIRPQYKDNFKLNPSLALNYRKRKINLFFQGDMVAQKALNKNEFIQRSYDDGTIIRQQFLENRTQSIATIKAGVDFKADNNNTFSLAALYNREGHIDRGDLPYYNNDLTERKRLWQYYEDEVNTAINTSFAYEHKFRQPGHQLKAGFNYTFHREDELFNFNNYLPATQSDDTTHLIADEKVSDFTVDYVKPLHQGRLELGSKLRWRYIPTNMVFMPGQNSILDLGAQGWANYNEFTRAVYGNYVYDSKKIEVEAGLRMESVKVNYEVSPTQNTYKSNGYNYFQPFPNLRIAYLLNDKSRLSFFYNRRVDRPDEQDLRIFPKYDDPEILKTGNPGLRPQFTQSIELGYKTNWQNGYAYSAVYLRFIDNILTRILTAPAGSTFINSIAQNAGNGRNEGMELILNQELTKRMTATINLNIYQNTINAFSIENVYPYNVSFRGDKEQMYSGNIKLNTTIKPATGWDVQVSAIYLAPDIIPQGRIESRYALDAGVKKSIQNGRGELFANINDLLNTMRIKKVVTSTGFTLKSRDLYETQVFRLGYAYRF
jgi:outer membrane receptor protein involved in Fe transport